jgi:hypothetical protein
MSKSQTRVLAVLGVFLCTLVLGAPLASASQNATATTATTATASTVAAAPSLDGDLLSPIFATTHSEAFYDPTHTPNCTWICSSGATGSATATSDSNCGSKCRTACGNICVF